MGIGKTIAATAALLLGVTSQAAPRRGIDLTAGGGVSSYTQDLNGITKVGVGYGARAGFHPFEAIGLELAYNGGINGFTITNHNLVSNQANGDLKLGIQTGPFSPYVFGGIGVFRLNVPERARPDTGLDNETLLSIPWGGGLSMDVAKNWTVEGRFQYDTLVSEKDNLDGRSADFWTATLNMGTVIGKSE